MLRFEQVSLQFPSLPEPTVCDCSFTVQTGELVVILGPSGCGKTTLLKLINRLYRPTAGRIYWDDQDIQQLPMTTLRRQMGYVIQQIGLFPHMTVAENIAVVPRLLGWPRTKIQARVDQLLDQVQLVPAVFRGRYPTQLSGGQQQRVGLARALAAHPKCLLMDEPFGALDAITRQTLQTELLRLQAQLPKTIVFVSHDIDEALRLADRLLIFDRGQLIQQGSPWQILTQPANRLVAQLVGADDILRQMGVVPVQSIRALLPAALSSENKLQIEAQASVREALLLLLQSGQPQLRVMEDDQAIGVVGFEQIQGLWRHPHRIDRDGSGSDPQIGGWPRQIVPNFNLPTP